MWWLMRPQCMLFGPAILVSKDKKELNQDKNFYLIQVMTRKTETHLGSVTRMRLVWRRRSCPWARTRERSSGLLHPESPSSLSMPRSPPLHSLFLPKTLNSIKWGKNFWHLLSCSEPSKCLGIFGNFWVWHLEEICNVMPTEWPLPGLI